MDFQNFLIHTKNVPLYPTYVKKIEDFDEIGDNCMIKGVDKKYRPMVCIIFVIKNQIIKDIFYKRFRLFLKIGMVLVIIYLIQVQELQKTNLI